MLPSTIANQKTEASRSEKGLIGRDSCQWVFDTTFYANKRIKTLGHRIELLNIQGLSESEQQNATRYLRQEYYAENGQLLLALLPDSLRLFVFKDNVNCYYGFKNRRGDTLISPRFDNVEKIEENYFLCTEGQNKVFMRLDGSVLLNIKADALKLLNSTNISDKESYGNGQATPQYFAIFANNTYLIVDTGLPRLCGADGVPGWHRGGAGSGDDAIGSR